MTILLKTLLSFSFLFIITLSNAQNSSSNDLEGGYLPIPLSVKMAQNDLEGRAEADEDWAKGEAKYHFSIGRLFNDVGRINSDLDYSLYFEHLGIFIHYFECLKPPNMEGYNMRIKEKLKEKYGRDMFKTLKKDRRIFYDSLNRLKTRNAIFSEGDKHFKMFLNFQCDYFKAYEKDIKFPQNVQIRLTCTINKKGKCKVVTISQTEDIQFNDRLLLRFKQFLKHCHWLPAKQNGRRIAEERTFDIVFNPDIANN